MMDMIELPSKIAEPHFEPRYQNNTILTYNLHRYSPYIIFIREINNSRQVDNLTAIFDQAEIHRYLNQSTIWQ